MAQKPTIFINPKFKNIHVNPNFLQQSNKVHVNPKFFVGANLLAFEPPLPTEPQVKPPPPPPPPAPSNAIIRNTRRTLIRASSSSRPNVELPVVPKLPPKPQHTLIKVSKNKLVTAAHLMQCQQKENEKIKNTTESIIKTKKLKRAEDPGKSSVYRVDRRTPKKKKIVSKYSIRRISPKKLIGDRKILKTVDNKMINISGVLYKSSSNKLVKSNPDQRVLLIRGEKFTLDPSGRRLHRESEGEGTPKLSRIDIGGLTYKASKSGDFERDNSHRVRNHLSTAKTKSISLLARANLKNSKLICPIYRRIGKCLAYANGRCQKVHDPRYVIVCPNFIKGSCKNEKCLLSHNANLHKMPVCKYFLQGLCQKTKDCLYLHKKLNDDTKLCAEFLKGYCPEAEMCNLLHDFPPSEHRDKKKYSIVRKKSKKEVKTPPATDQVRYYIDGETSESTGDNVPKRHKLQSLPSYIPL